MPHRVRKGGRRLVEILEKAGIKAHTYSHAD